MELSKQKNYSVIKSTHFRQWLFLDNQSIGEKPFYDDRNELKVPPIVFGLTNHRKRHLCHTIYLKLMELAYMKQKTQKTPVVGSFVFVTYFFILKIKDSAASIMVSGKVGCA